ncbi:MAG: extracellular solute-binding protein [Patescibacteria group bacterium]
MKYIIAGAFVVMGLFWFLVWAGVIPGLKTSSATRVAKGALTIWSVDDNAAVMKGVIEAFSASNPGIKVSFIPKNPATYEDELVRAFAAGTGPDVFSVHHTWPLRYADILAPAPRALAAELAVRERFVDVVARDFLLGDNLYGVPLYVDTLALYYNTNLFNSAGIVLPPEDWDAFVKDSRALTRRTANGDIEIAGAALGGARNVVNASDILAMLMLQYGAPMTGEDGKSVRLRSAGGTAPSEQALAFYASFARANDPHFSWSKDFSGTSEDLFSQNKAAMMLGYSGARARIVKKSPYVQFAVAPLPQVQGAVFHKNYADYWGYGAYKSGTNKDAAWQFVSFLAQSGVSRAYLAATGRPAAQRTLVVEQQQNPAMKAFANQSLTAVSWAQPDATVVRDVFLEMIEAQITTDQPVKQTIQNGESKINALVKKTR